MLRFVEHRVGDPRLISLIRRWLKAGILEDGEIHPNENGTPQGGWISPLLSNLYLTEVDIMLERAKETTRCGKYTYIEYARFADDLVILIDAYSRHDWLMAAVEKRLREELAKLQVEINEEKSRIVDLGRGESFGFLGLGRI
jgi:RNA-directed DNA polymerase